MARTTRIRPAKADDLPALVRLNAMVQKLHAQHMPTYFKNPSRRNRRDTWFAKVLSDPQASLVVAESGGAVIGYFYAQEASRSKSWLVRPSRFFMLEHLAVEPSHRCKGVGRALMNRFFVEARKRRLRRAELVQWSFNEEAENFFGKCGFNPIYVHSEASF
jgi:ribosomal protein S18 acetylase RimI-like enzyme